MVELLPNNGVLLALSSSVIESLLEVLSGSGGVGNSGLRSGDSIGEGRDGGSKVDDLSLGVHELAGNLLDELFVVSLSSSLSISLHGFGHFHVLLNSVHDVKESLDDSLVGVDFHGFLNNLSEEFEEGTITVGDTSLGGHELSKSSDEGGLHTGLGLEEGVSTSDESGIDDGSAVIKDTEDGSVLSLEGSISLSFSGSLSTEGLEHSLSVTDFSDLVGELLLSGLKGSRIESSESNVFTGIGTSLGEASHEFSEVSITSIMLAFSHSLGVSHLGLKTTNNTSHAVNKSINLLTGFELELDGGDEGSSIFSISNLKGLAGEKG